MRTKPRVIFGALLILGGALLLLQSLGILKGSAGTVIWAVSLGAAGIFCIMQYFSNRKNWWWIIPGITLIAVSLSQVLDLFLPALSENYSGAIVLGGIGLSFLLIYLSNSLHWWAIIPAGVLFTTGLVSIFDEISISNLDTGGIFFLGLGLTFLILTVLPTPHGRLKWAIFPAVPLLIMGAYLLFSEYTKIWDAAGPAIIIIAGIYFLYAATRKK